MTYVQTFNVRPDFNEIFYYISFNTYIFYFINFITEFNELKV